MSANDGGKWAHAAVLHQSPHRSRRNSAVAAAQCVRRLLTVTNWVNDVTVLPLFTFSDETHFIRPVRAHLPGTKGVASMNNWLQRTFSRRVPATSLRNDPPAPRASAAGSNHRILITANANVISSDAVTNDSVPLLALGPFIGGGDRRPQQIDAHVESLRADHYQRPAHDEQRISFIRLAPERNVARPTSLPPSAIYQRESLSSFFCFCFRVCRDAFRPYQPRSAKVTRMTKLQSNCRRLRQFG